MADLFINFTQPLVTSFQLWCAAAVSACEGRTKDGGTVVGAASIFYDKHNEQSNAASTVNQGSESSPLHKLNQARHFLISSIVSRRTNVWFVKTFAKWAVFNDS